MLVPPSQEGKGLWAALRGFDCPRREQETGGPIY